MLISECRYVIFMFGQSPENGGYVNSTGMLKEYELAKERGKIIIPVGCTGYTASEIWKDVQRNITLYPYIERYIDTLGAPLETVNIDQLVSVILQIIADCS